MGRTLLQPRQSEAAVKSDTDGPLLVGNRNCFSAIMWPSLLSKLSVEKD